MKVPAHTIRICMGSSCFARGNGLNAELLQRMVDEGALDSGSLDAGTGPTEICGTLCEGLCKDGPIVLIDDVVHRRVTPTTLQDILKIHAADKGTEN